MASIFVCGDIFLPPGVEDFIGNELIDIISQADYAIGNLEGVTILRLAKLYKTRVSIYHGSCHS